MSNLAERKARLIVHGETPYNAETPLLSAARGLPHAGRGFLRALPRDVPAIAEDVFRFIVDGAVSTALKLSLHDLRSRFPQVVVTATMQCAGNRRADMRVVAPVSGDPWDGGAIGTADWTGVRLGTVLREAGIHEGADLHVAFESHDTVEGHPYGVSIPTREGASAGKPCWPSP